MRFIFIILLVICSCNIDAINQGQQRYKNIRHKQDEVIIENVDSIKHLADSLQVTVSLLDSLRDANMRQIDTLEQKIYNDSLAIYVLIREIKDSLEKEIAIRDKELTFLRENANFIDTCAVKLANRWLFQPYDKKAVSDAIKYFDRMYSSKTKEGFSIVQKLLKDYEQSHKEFQRLLREAQSDSNRTNPFACEEYKTEYKRRIESMLYYVRYYNSDWNIRYLNEQIGKALEMLKNHSADKVVDFTLLIESNVE